MITLSVIVPVFNTGNFLLECLGSIFDSAENFVDLEVIVVDDLSTDPLTLSCLASVEKMARVKVFYREKNGGPAICRNFGVRQATSEWVAFLDSDDKFLLDSISLRVEALKAYPSASWIAGRYVEEEVIGFFVDKCAWGFLTGSGQKIADHFYVVDDPLPLLIPGNPTIHLGATMIKRSEFMRNGGFDDKLRYGEDWLFNITMASAFRLAWIDAPLMVLRRYHESMMKNRRALGRGVARAPVLAYFSGKFSSFKKNLRWKISSDYRWASNELMASGDYLEALHKSMMSIFWVPNDLKNYQSLWFCFRRILKIS